MIVTINEVEQWSLRAMAGGGAPAGIDEEAAQATAWLAARGFPAIEALICALERWRDNPWTTRLLEAGSESGLESYDAAGRSALFLCGTIIDLSVAAATAGTTPGQVNVFNLADPMFLLPAAERYRRKGWQFEFFWRDPTEGDAIVAVNVSGEGPQLFGTLDDIRAVGPFNLSLVCGCGLPFSRAGEEKSLPQIPKARDLARCYGKTLKRGIVVNTATWSKLKVHGRRALVPASEHSRARGAGEMVAEEPPPLSDE